jgi:eukaryotic-like serine/threonine-protein kinase
LTIDPNNTFALTNKDAILHMLGNNSTYSTYENSTYGIRVQYPSDWSVQESNTTGTLIKIATFFSPTGPDSDPTAGVTIYMDKLLRSTTTLNNYAHFVAFTDYENNTNFHAFKLLELNTNSSILAGKPAYTLIGTYDLHSFGLQKLMEVGTIIGDKVYYVQYIADAPRYTDYLPIVQKMIQSLVIK